MSAGLLFCQACREQLSLTQSVITNHVRSSKHQKSTERLKVQEVRERDITSSLIQHSSEIHLKGESIPRNQQVHRVKVVTVRMVFPIAGEPLRKMEAFREILEINALCLTDLCNMHDYVPFFLKEKRAGFVMRSMEGSYPSFLMALQDWVKL